MKAAVCHAFGEALVIEDVALDAPRPGEVAVRLAACAICHSDILYMQGAWGGTLPAVYGHEAAGVVEAVGDGVTDLAPGTSVVVSLLRACGRCFFCRRGQEPLCEGRFASDAEPRLHLADGRPLHQGLRTGAFAEAVVVDRSQVVAVPAELPPASASLLACGVLTGFGAVVNTAALPAGASAVVIGTGGVGLNCVQGAAVSGAEPVIALDLSPAKRDAARAFGATHALNPAATDAREAVRALTDGRGADYVFVAAGSAAAIEAGTGLMRRGGTLVVVGMTASGVKARIEALDIADDAQRILGSKMGGAHFHQDVPRLVGLYREGRLKLDELVTGRFPLSAINEAIADVGRDEALRNVIVF